MESSTLKPRPQAKHIIPERITSQSIKNIKQHSILVVFENFCLDSEVGSINTLLNKPLNIIINMNRPVAISLSNPNKMQVANNAVITIFDFNNIYYSRKFYYITENNINLIINKKTSV